MNKARVAKGALAGVIGGLAGTYAMNHVQRWWSRAVNGAEPESISFGWRRFAFNSYIALQKVDTRVLEPYLPAELFYNLLVSARKPA